MNYKKHKLEEGSRGLTHHEAAPHLKFYRRLRGINMHTTSIRAIRYLHKATQEDINHNLRLQVKERDIEIARLQKLLDENR